MPRVHYKDIYPLGSTLSNLFNLIFFLLERYEYGVLFVNVIVFLTSFLRRALSGMGFLKRVLYRSFHDPLLIAQPQSLSK